MATRYSHYELKTTGTGRPTSTKKYKQDPTYYRRWNLKKAYNLTPQEWDNLFLVQKGLCGLCWIRTKLHVDHNHTTGEVRGLLCQPCNTALGFFEKRRNTPWFTRAINYLGGL